MAKGGASPNDKLRETDYRSKQADEYLNKALEDFVSPQGHDFWNRFVQESQAAEGEKKGIQGQLGDLMGRYGGLAGQFGQYAKTGGLSEGDAANLRARAISPIRSVYSRSLAELDRNKALHGGYMPNYAAARSRFARDQGQLTSDATTNAEAAIAEMRQKGKLAGLQGVGSALSGMGSTIGQGASLYGATPGMASWLGSAAQRGTDQILNMGQLRNQLTGDLIRAAQNRQGVDWKGWINTGANALGAGSYAFGKG